MEVRCEQRLISAYHNYHADNRCDAPTMIYSANAVDDIKVLNQKAGADQGKCWSSQQTKPGHDCYFENTDYVNLSSNQADHQLAIHNQHAAPNMHICNSYQASATDYSSNNYHYYQNTDCKEWWSSQADPGNTDIHCPQAQSYGYGYYDYQNPNNITQQSVSSQHDRNHHENIQFSYYHGNCHYETHYEQRFSCQAINPIHNPPASIHQQTSSGERHFTAELAVPEQVQPACVNRDLKISLDKPYNWSISGSDVTRLDHHAPGDNNQTSSGSSLGSQNIVSCQPVSFVDHPASVKLESMPVIKPKSSSCRSAHGRNQSGTITGANIVSQRTNQCGVCGRNYARPSTLKTHLRTHTNERPFKCNVCLKTFSQAANLTAHQRVHTGERPFSCPICDRQFSQSSSVITHLRTHSGERPYRCNMCSRTFSDSSTLTKHCRIHSGEKPYQCDHCPLNFSQSGNLSRHLRLHQINSLGSSSITSQSANKLRHIQQHQAQKKHEHTVSG